MAMVVFVNVVFVVFIVASVLGLLAWGIRADARDRRDWFKARRRDRGDRPIVPRLGGPNRPIRRPRDTETAEHENVFALTGSE